MSSNGKIRVLVVDDSLITTQVITRILESDPQFQVVGKAHDGEAALREVERLQPDVVTMDINMPGMDGLQATRAIVRRHGTPIVIVSAWASANSVAIQTLQALMSGAIESVQKPSGEIGLDLDLVAAEMIAKVKAASRARPWTSGSVSRPPPAPRTSEMRVPGDTTRWTSMTTTPLRLVAIGVSTGGPSTLERFLPKLPADYPVPILLVIHMPAVFIPILASTLNDACKLRVTVAAEGEAALQGRVYIGPGDIHMEITPDLRVRLKQGPPVNGCVPSVDVLFDSVARTSGGRALGLVLTGMGRDGAKGLGEMRRHGCLTAAQDEKSAVVYGMPRAAMSSGAAAYEVPLDEMDRFLLRAIGR